MSSDLLICAAIDLSGGDWFAGASARIVGSLALGKAGDIRQGVVAGAHFSARRDVVPGTETPRTSSWEVPAEEEGSHLLFAGRLVERRDLAARLGINLPSDDSALYARAYARWGDCCDAELLGEYAVIQYWPGKRRVRIARSPLRAPPLHVWRDRTQLVVASLPRSIFAAGVTAEVDPDRLADLALFNRSHPERSLYRGLSRVPCGAQEMHDPDGKTLRQYWRVEGVPKRRFASPTEAIDAVTEQFARSARANLEGVSRPSISLSGGLDSQTSASFLLGEGGASRLASFTSVPVADWLPEAGDGLIYDERPRVQAFAAMHPALDPHFIEARDATVGEDLERKLLLGSWPTYNEMNMHWVHSIYRAAAAAGGDVLFNADMGDAGFSYDGLTAFPTWLRTGNLARLIHELRLMADGRSLARRFASHVIWPFLAPRLRREIDRKRGAWTDPFATWCPLDPDHPTVKEAIARADAEGHDIGLYSAVRASGSRARMLAPTISEGPEVNQALRLLHGVETRDLTAFRPLFELCAGLPDDLFFSDGHARWLARQVAKGRVPDEVAAGTAIAIQSADFIARAARDRATLGAMVTGQLPAGSAGSIIDRRRLLSDIEAIDQPNRGGPHAWLRLACALPRGVAFARFVKYVEGHNHG